VQSKKRIFVSEFNPAYRRDIDGLRAIAVLSVLAFHAFPDALPGGFLGVDIFFVVSGFLITTIILQSLAAGNFSYRDFYARRIRRIFPALVLVLLATLAFGWYVLLPGEFSQLGKQAIGGAAFFANLVFLGDAGYFDVTSETKPLLHLWSLGIEEQFYIFWPLVLGLAWRKRWPILRVTLAVAAISFLINVLTVQTHPAAAFYSPLSRAWELLAGGLLAAMRLQTVNAPGGAADSRAWTKRAQSIVGVGLIVLGLYMTRSTKAFPDWWALLPVLGAVSCIAAGPNGVLNRYLLSNRVMVWIGLISYPLYLWHWPLLVYARILELGGGHWSIRLGVLALSVVLAYFTYRLVERPLRSATGHQRARLIGLVTPMILICAVGVAAVQTNGFGSRLKGTPLEFASHEYDFFSDAQVGKCWLGGAAAFDAYSEECSGSAGASPSVLIWGDSHAGRFAPGLRRALGDEVGVAAFVRDSCPGILNVEYANCAKANAYVLGQIKKLRPRSVVLFASWTFYLRPVSGLQAVDFQNTFDALKAAGVSEVIVMGPAPKWREPLPALLTKYHRQHPEDAIPRRTSFGLTSQSAEAETELSALVPRARGVEYFSTYGALCDLDGCMTMLNNTPEGLTTWDYGHLTTSGADIVAMQLVARFPGLRQP
jgi:peptidoglycan/LPS O-acetylase OafA/YrhL